VEDVIKKIKRMITKAAGGCCRVINRIEKEGRKEGRMQPRSTIIHNYSKDAYNWTRNAFYSILSGNTTHRPLYELLMDAERGRRRNVNGKLLKQKKSD
jgi:hypothetical protein